MELLASCVVTSPIGRVLLVADSDALRAVHFEGSWPSVIPSADAAADRVHPVLREARDQLHAYFAGKLRTFSIPLALKGTTFQLRVWAALRSIPFGEVLAYQDIALRTGNPQAVRAVGAANGRNPLPIVIPCHRVIGSDGSLTGFGGGLPRKRWLLQHEGALTPQML